MAKHARWRFVLRGLGVSFASIGCAHWAPCPSPFRVLGGKKGAQRAAFFPPRLFPPPRGGAGGGEKASTILLWQRVLKAKGKGQGPRPLLPPDLLLKGNAPLNSPKRHKKKRRRVFTQCLSCFGFAYYAGQTLIALILEEFLVSTSVSKVTF